MRTNVISPMQKLSMPDKTQSLYKKLKYIFYDATILIKKVESKHFNIIKKVWGVNAEEIVNNLSLFRRATLAPKYIVDEKNTGDNLVKAYLGALQEIKIIENIIDPTIASEKL